MNVQSREKRAKVTDRIRNSLIDLVEQEKDYEKKKKHPAIWYREQIADMLKLPDSDNPSLRSYEETLKPIRKKYQEDNPLDNPWSIGSCIEHDIPADMIPLLIEKQRYLAQRAGKIAEDAKKYSRHKITEGDIERLMSIRIARWMAKLYPIVSQLVDKRYPDKTEQPGFFLGILFRIATEYSRKEKAAEIFPKQLDTFTLDTFLFVSDDFSPDGAMVNALIAEMTPGQFNNFQTLVKAIENVNESVEGEK